MRGFELHSSPRTYTSTAALLTDTDGVKTVAAAPIAVTDYTGVALNGAVQTAGFVFPRYPTVTTTVNAATYNTTDPILVTGTRGGVTVIVPLLLTAAGGGETIVGTTPLETVTNIRVPVQLQAAGGLAFGVVDLGPFADVKAGAITDDMPYRAVKASGVGTLVIGYKDGGFDTLTCVEGQREDVLAYRVYATSTATPITVYT